MAASSNGPRYAPEDPTLPKPWRGLIDGKTGYLYFWNPETNITQYERPVVKQPAGQLPPPPPPPKSNLMSVSSSVQHRDLKEEDGHNAGPRNHHHHHSQRGGSGSHSQNQPNGVTSLGNSASHGYGHGYSSQNLRSSAKGSSDTGGNLSVEAYMRQHEITVLGDDVPAPLMTFESTGFTDEMLKEVRYLLQEGANVVRCAMSDLLIWGDLLLVGKHPSSRWTEFGQALLHRGRDCSARFGSAAWSELRKAYSPATTCGIACICKQLSRLREALLVRHAGFPSPTPIQAQAWPVVMQSRDVVAIAKTGSGKTLGYLLPGFMHINRLRNNSRAGPTVLVLAPTRELATQILDEALKFGRSSRISSTCLYGGAPKGPQLRDIDRGVDVVVATPGRLNDILEMRRISLRQVSYLVLDEADRMLDMGFEPQIRKIVKEIPARRQTLMFTATWPKEVRKIAADLLVKPAQVNIGSIDELVANKAITQYVEIITPMEKQRRLEQILRSQEAGSKILIFCSTKRMCEQLARSLTRQFGAAAIHGDKSQNERDHVLGQFRTGRSPILVATDVAARGLDIKDVRVVINYDFPTGIEDYVHRIGRTGRAGATGVSYTFFSDQDAKYASDLVKVLEGAGQRVPREIRDMSLRSRGGGRGKFRRWASTSGGRDAGRSNDTRIDSGYGGRGPGMDGRSEGGRGGRGQGDRDRDRAYDSLSGDARTKHETDRRAVERDLDTKGARGTHDQRAWDKDTAHGRGRSRSRSPSANRGRGITGSKRSRSRSRSRDRGRSPARRSRSPSRRSRSRSRSRGRRHVGGLRREPSPKDARAAPQGPSPADIRATGYSRPEYKDGHPSPCMQERLEHLRSPIKRHSPRHASGYHRSPTPSDDRPAPGYGRSPSPMDDRPPAGYGRSPVPMDDRTAPGYGHSPTPMDDRPAPGYGRSPTPTDDRHAPGFDPAPTLLHDRPAPGFDRLPTPKDERSAPGFDRSPTPMDERSAPGFDRCPTPTDDRPAPGFDHSPAPMDGKHGTVYDYSPTPVDDGPAPGYDRSPFPLDDRHAPGYSRSPTPMDDTHARGYDRSPTPLDDAPAPGFNRSPTPREERQNLSRYNRTPSPERNVSHSPFPLSENGWAAATQENSRQRPISPASGHFPSTLSDRKEDTHRLSNPADEEEEGMIPADEESAISGRMQQE